jgi:uracil-DNA glycosylase
MSLKRKASTLPLADAKKPKVNGSITSFFGAPKAAAAPTKVTTAVETAVSTAPPATNTDADALPLPQSDWKKKWIASLTEEQKHLLVLEIETLHESWLKELKDEITSASFIGLKRFLKKEHEAGKKIFPPAIDVYAW